MRKRGRSHSERAHSRDRAHRDVVPPPVPTGFRCHICDSSHWTVDCPRVRANPSKYASVDVRHGCFQCGQRGHPSSKCTVKKFKCSECGALHDTVQCPYSYEAVEWHEFFDSTRQRVFFVNAAKLTQIVWDTPNKLDTVLWHCNTCSLLIPDAVPECVNCHASRPVNVRKVTVVAEDAQEGQKVEQADEVSCRIEECVAVPNSVVLE